MTVYGLLSDVHASRHPPASCTDSYLADLLDLLGQGFAVFREHGAAAAVIAGDLFHHKAPTRTPHELVEVLGKLFLAQPFPVWVVPGNHDMQHDRMESLPGQPLGVLFGLGAAHCLDGWMGGEHPVFGVPWLQHWSAEAVSEALRAWREQRSGRTLVVTHAPLYPWRSEPRYDGAEFTPADWWAGPLQDGDIRHSVFYGHIHESHGTWNRLGVRFCNNGALSRGSLDEYNLEREVGVTLWDDGTGGCTFVPLRARPASEVFRLREHEQAATAQLSLKAFLHALGSAVLPRLTPQAVMAQFRESGAGKDELALAEELLEWSAHEGKAKR